MFLSLLLAFALASSPSLSSKATFGVSPAALHSYDPMTYCGVTAGRGAPLATIPALTEAEKQRLGNAVLAKASIVFRHGDRTSFGWQTDLSRANAPDSDVLYAARQCWPGDVAVWDCDDATHVEAPGATQAAQRATPRLFRYNYGADENAQRGTCGQGHLTPRGAAQQMANGGAVRSAYVGKLLPKRLADARGALYLRTTDVPRTRLSLMNFLKGLYPPESSASELADVFNVDTRDQSSENAIPNPVLCPALLDVAQEMKQSAAYQAWAKRWLAPLLAKLSAALQQNITDGDALNNVADCVRAHVCHDKRLPPWLSASMLASMASVDTSYYTYLLSYPDRASASRLAIGTFFRDVAVRAATLGASTPVVAVYSAHDTTVWPMLLALNATGFVHWPPYAAALTIETYAAAANASAVAAYRVIYDGAPLSLYACQYSSVCSAAEWKRIVESVVTSRVAELCAGPSLPPGHPPPPHTMALRKALFDEFLT